MIYVDANVFIYPVLYKGKKAKKAKRILKEIIDGKRALTSCLTIGEVVWKIWTETDRSKGVKEGKRLFYFPNLKVVRNRPKEVFSALNLMEKYKALKPRDAIHLATALERNIHKIISDDGDFDSVEEVERIGLES